LNALKMKHNNLEEIKGLLQIYLQIISQVILSHSQCNDIPKMTAMNNELVKLSSKI